MPFWWRRRRKPWFTSRWRSYRRRRPFKNKRRRTRYNKRRRTTRTNRRRRRRKHKVRRKKRTIPIRQWQPDSIRNCKIRGFGILVLGAEGTQMFCYTTDKKKYVPPKVPYGGGLGVEVYTLRYLYEEHKLLNNFWTASNMLKDLCRYLWCKITVFRHVETDFVVSFDTQPPFHINKYTYPATHPHQQLLNKRKKIILSLASKPNGKYYKKFYIKPTKQMISKWFFTKEFSKQPLFLLRGAACNFRYSYLTATNTNLLVNLVSLNTSFYKHSNWAQHAGTQPYVPYTHVADNLEYVIKTKSGTEQTKTMTVNSKSPYKESVSYDKGWFNSEFLRAIQIKQSGTLLATTPTIAGRYNPTTDDGIGNKIYLVSTLTDGWDTPRVDKQLIIEEMPLWLGLYGFISYIKTVKPSDYLKSSVIALVSKSIYAFPQIGAGLYVPIDIDYLQGKRPYDQVISTADKDKWYPEVAWQTKSLNAIVESGPFMHKLSEERNSTWELKYEYLFKFKWGGPHVTDQEIKDPQDLDTYDVPDTMPKKIQIRDPEKQTPESIIHAWDIRRGIIKEAALKRMCDNISTDTEFQPFTEEPPQKKKKYLGAALRDPQEEVKKIQACLQDLCKENICQEQETQTLQELIQQQQQQQEQLKYNILMLLTDLKCKQREIQLQTGMLE
nr:MAG: ORF1 [Torque teno midi virus]